MLEYFAISEYTLLDVSQMEEQLFLVGSSHGPTHLKKTLKENTIFMHALKTVERNKEYNIFLSGVSWCVRGRPDLLLLRGHPGRPATLQGEPSVLCG